MFNGDSFLRFLKQLVRRYRRQKVFLIIDNGPWHRLYEDGQRWLRANEHRIELHRLPPYSPEFNPMEGVWKTTRRSTTHNRFFLTTAERDSALIKTFKRFQRRPKLIAPQVLRFR